MVDLPNYDNTQKWLTAIRRNRRRFLKIGIPTLLILGAVWYFYHYLPIKKLNSELAQTNAASKQKDDRIATQKDDLSALRHQVEILTTSNATYQILYDPVRKIAQELHPELELSAAISKLSDDLKEVRSLATRDVFQPLADPARSELVNSLKMLQGWYGTNQISVEFTIENGNKNRRLFTEEWVSIVNDGGLKAAITSSGTSFFSGTPPDVSMNFNPNDMQMAQTFAKLIQPLVNTKFAGAINSVSTKGVIQINVVGEPLFLPNGSVIFR